MCVGGCISSCKFILNSHLHALTQGQLWPQKTSMLLTLKINQLLFRGNYVISGENGSRPGEVFSTFLSWPYLLWCLNQYQLLGRLNDIHQLSDSWPGDEAFHCDFVITAASLAKWDGWPCVITLVGSTKLSHCRTMSFSPLRLGCSSLVGGVRKDADVVCREKCHPR